MKTRGAVNSSNDGNGWRTLVLILRRYECKDDAKDRRPIVLNRLLVMPPGVAQYQQK